METKVKVNKVKLSLTQAVEFFSLTPIQKEIAKRLWKENEQATAEDWKDRFNSKKIINN